MHTQPASGRAWLESVWTRHIAQEQGREGERKVSLSLCVPLSFDQAHGWIRQREEPSFSISAGLLQPPLYFLDESQFTMVRNGASSWQNISSREREIGLTPPWVVLGLVNSCVVQTIAAGYEVWGRTDSRSLSEKLAFTTLSAAAGTPLWGSMRLVLCTVLYNASSRVSSADRHSNIELVAINRVGTEMHISTVVRAAKRWEAVCWGSPIWPKSRFYQSSRAFRHQS